MLFPFTFDEGELRNAYQGWELVKYNEDLGTMHNGGRFKKMVRPSRLELPTPTMSR